MIKTRRLKNVVIFIQTTSKLYILHMDGCLMQFCSNFLIKATSQSDQTWGLPHLYQFVHIHSDSIFDGK